MSIDTSIELFRFLDISSPWGILPLAVALTLWPGSVVGGEQLELRLYAQGRLTAEDFRAVPPREIPRVGNANILSETKTEVRYNFRYVVTQSGRVYVARLAEIDVFALLSTERSWNAAPENARLLAHEQGHFDLAQRQALRARAAFLSQIREGNPLSASAATPDAALVGLQQKVRDSFAPWIDELRRADLAYDEETAHGTLRGAQAKFQRRTADELVAAQAELDRLLAE